MLFISAFAFAGLLISFRSSDPVTLRLNLKEGATYEYNTTMDQKITTSVAGQSYASNINMASTIYMKVEKKYGDDSMLLQTKYTHMVVNTSAMGQTTSFDSNDSSTESGSELGKIFKVMSQNPVSITADPSGKIIRIDRIDQLSKSIDASMNGGNPAMKKMMESLFNEQTYKHAFTNLNMYENKPVNIGDTWNQDISMTSFVPIDINLTYTVKEINPSNVVLNVTGDIQSTSDSTTISGMTIPIHVTGKQTGIYTIDRATGLITTGNVDQDIHTKMSMMGQDLNVETEGNTFITEKRKLSVKI